MIWTESAKKYFENFLFTYLKVNSKEGIIQEDFEQDIRNHIEEVCKEANKEKIEDQDVQDILKKMNFPNLNELKSNIATSNEKQPIGKIKLIFYIIFLVIIPQICSIVAWSITKGNIPTNTHSVHFNKILLVLWALSGLSNGYLLYIFMTHKFEKQKLFFYLLNFNIFFCAYYMINFIVILPLGFISLVFFGFGLLIFAPYNNFIILMLLGYKFKRKLIEQNIFIKKGYKKFGLICFTLVFIFSYLIELLSLLGYRLYQFDSIEMKNWGRKLLTTINAESGNVQLIGESFILLKVNIDKKEHYKIFGKLPQNQRDNWDERSESILKNLEMNDSEIDGSFNVENGIAYMEWTMKFNNKLEFNSEATALIKLPKDAVVSRLTLWVEGEEREAAFAKESIVEAAYNSIVTKNRDPVLVQYKSPDIISMKCFPISKATPMKIRIGISSPIQYSTQGNSYVKMPYFLKTNFQFKNDLNHHIWIESKFPLEFNNETSKKTEQGYKLKLNLNNDAFKNSIAISMPFNNQKIKNYYYKLYNDKILISSIIENAPINFEKIILIVDFGAMIKNEFFHFENALKKLPKNVELIAYCVGDSVKKIHIAKSNDAPEQLKTEILKFKYTNDLVGGHDFMPVLIDAIEEYGVSEKNIYVWIHGDITYAISEPEPLEKIFKRSNIKPNILEFSTIDAINVLTTKSKELANISQGFGKENGLKNLSDFFYGLDKPTINLEFELKEFINQTEFLEGNKHHARLWVNQEIKKMGMNSEENKKKAIELSVKYQLVTPFVGAVVLENQSQYDQFDLNPVEASSVPSIPEPEEIALIIVLLILFVYILKFKKFGAAQNV